MNPRSSQHKWRNVFLHLAVILGAALVLSLWIFLSPNTAEEVTGSPTGAPSSLFATFLQVATGLCCFLLPPVYFAVYWLVPKTLLEKRYLLFVLLVVVVVVGWGLLVGTAEAWTDEHLFGGSPAGRSSSDGIAVVFFILLITILLNLSYRWFVQTARMQQMKTDQLNRELSLLRNQINPHFFFNTLNNLYALALEQSEKTPDVILKLSEMMRYAIYECKEPEVLVSSEVNYLKNYIALQELRQHTASNIHFQHHIDLPQAKIAPMILIVFVENAFKHGLDSLSEGGYVQIDLAVKEGEIKFEVENNFEARAGEGPGGLGLENVGRRLSLVYGERYDLAFQEGEDRFRVTLRIQL